MTEQLTLSKASKIIGVTTKTLRNWDDAGKIKTTRTSGNHRRISMDEIRRLQGTTQSPTQVKKEFYNKNILIDIDTIIIAVSGSTLKQYKNKKVSELIEMLNENE